MDVLSAGATGDGITDDTVAIQSVLDNYDTIYFPAPPVAYRTSASLEVLRHYMTLIGDGIRSVISSSVANQPVITIPTPLTGTKIAGLRLTREVTATSGGDGLYCANIHQTKVLYRDLFIDKQYIGMNLGPTFNGWVENCLVQSCQGIGVAIRNTPTVGQCQWEFDTVYSQTNGSQGFLVTAVAGPTQLIIGTFRNCVTFANSAHGIAFSGLPNCPIQDVRIYGGIYGENGASSVYLDTYGDQHIIADVFTELSGRRTTGPTLSVPATNAGRGFEITPNNTSVQYSGCHAQHHSMDGFNLSAGSNSLANCRAIGNGVAQISGQRNGIKISGGKATITGGRSGNRGAETQQQYGVYAANGANVSVGFMDLAGNSTAARAATANYASMANFGNL